MTWRAQRHEGSHHRGERNDRLGRRRRAARARQRGRRASAGTPSARARPTAPSPGTPGSRRPSARPTRRSPSVDAVVNLIGEEINQRLTTEAKRRIRDSRVRATKNLVDGIAAAGNATGGPAVLVSQAAVGYYGDHGDAIIDESTAPGSEWLSQARRRVGGRGARGRELRDPRRDLPHRAATRPRRRAAEATPADLQARRRRPAGERAPVHALDPPRRRGRADHLGAREREGHRRLQRDRAEPGHEPGVLEDARQGPAPAVAHPGAEVRRQRRCAARSSRTRSPTACVSSPAGRSTSATSSAGPDLEPALRDLLGR